MPNSTGGPLIIQSDRSILLEVDHPAYEAARDELIRFAELEKSPEHIHTYRLTPLSIWNACAAGLSARTIISRLQRFSRYELPQNVEIEVKQWVSRYGRLRLVRNGESLVLESDDVALTTEIWRDRSVRKYLLARLSQTRIEIDPRRRGHVKQALVKLGFPAEDLAGYAEGKPLPFELLEITRSGDPFVLRGYQREAADVFFAGGAARGGSGVIALPCGAGKTIVGMAAAALVKMYTLILVTSTIAVRQWRRELLDKTSLAPDQIGEYTGEVKEIKPLTICTYQPWKVLEKQGWIAQAECFEIRVSLPDAMRTKYALADKRAKFRMASENTNKLEVLRRIVNLHEDDSILIIGHYLDQLHRVAAETDAPIITGKTPNSLREELYGKFRAGEIKCLILSKVGNFAIDLPDASVAIQISGTFGSRQEEAQRLGRILRPKADGRKARFYSLVTRDTRDQEFAAKRHLFLAEQGYSYRISDAHQFLWQPSGVA